MVVGSYGLNGWLVRLQFQGVYGVKVERAVSEGLTVGKGLVIG
jgi:hypothetical protein